MNPSRNLFLIGPTGAGKSSLGRRLAAHYELSFVDLDHAIEQRTGTTIATIFAIEGEAGFRHRESTLLDEFSASVDIVLATGAGAVLDPHNRALLASRGCVLWVQAGVEQQLARLSHDSQRPLLAGTDLRAKLQAMAAIREPLYREIADLILPVARGFAASKAQAVALTERDWQRHPLPSPSTTA